MGSVYRWTNRLFTDVLDVHQVVDYRAEAFEEVLDVVPGSGDPLSVQAQSATFCLLAAIDSERVTREGGGLGVVMASRAVVDAVDNFVFFIREKMSGSLESPRNGELMQRELRRQKADAVFLRDFNRVQILK